MRRNKKNIRRYPIPLEVQTFLSKISDNTDLEDINQLDPNIHRIWKILAAGISKENYLMFFHYTLWFEESHKKLDMKLSKVGMYEDKIGYALAIPTEKQESQNLRLGDMIKLKRHKTDDEYIATRIKKMERDMVFVKCLRKQNHDFTDTDYVDVKFSFPSKLFEMLHDAVEKIYTSNKSYIFPIESYVHKESTQITRYFNTNIKHNAEQRTAVQCILSGTSRNAPFLLLGPPGTGKTVTIAEAILQLVATNCTNRILVSAHSNKAVDNVACVLQKYKEHFDEEPNKLLLRINSKGRKSCIPKCLKDDSTIGPVHLEKMMKYRIILCTLCSLSNYNLNFISHVVIDEAAQANEPSCLIPISRISGVRPLILSGDDQQLGPVVVSNVSKKFGLGLSLMERLRDNFSMYQDNDTAKHMVMLKNNYRSDAKIIDLPNRLFYDGHLRAMAALDPLSNRNILNVTKKCRATVFHQVFSTEIKVGPSFCNNDELDIIKLYVVQLIFHYKVKEEDIGIIATYKGQVRIIKEWIDETRFKIDVETVDAFQGQEKRAIIISTVRGKGKQADASLGFVTDVKRFNVALTRAKAKVIVIGNPMSLLSCSVWRSYILFCKALGTRYGHAEKISSISGILHMIRDIKISN